VRASSRRLRRRVICVTVSRRGAATGQLDTDHLDKCCVTDELSLDGAVRPVAGVLPMAFHAREGGQVGVLLPAANVREAAAAEGVEPDATGALWGAVTMLESDSAAAQPVHPPPDERALADPPYDEGLADVKARPMAKPMLGVAAAGETEHLAPRPWPLLSRPSTRARAPTCRLLRCRCPAMLRCGQRALCGLGIAGAPGPLACSSPPAGTPEPGRRSGVAETRCQGGCWRPHDEGRQREAR